MSGATTGAKFRATIRKVVMEVSGYRKSYNTFGGSALYSPIADLLSVRLSEYGDAVEEIEFTGYLRSKTRNPRPTLEDLFDQFHEYLDSLPSITFRRKKNRVEIEFVSEHFTDQDENSVAIAPVEKLRLAAEEVGSALSLIRKRIKSSDDFDTDRFLADADKILATEINTPEEWKQIREEARKMNLAIQATKSPWELLDIDWDDYHPQARDLLDDTFFWECTDDFAPNGNDTGADLLEDFRRWHKRHPRTSPMKFLDGLMKQWGIEPIDWLTTDKKTVRKLEQEEPIGLSVCNEAAIALAFAVIKLRAACPPDVKQRALAALTRHAIAVGDSDLGEQVKTEWDVAIEKMRMKLESLTNQSE